MIINILYLIIGFVLLILGGNWLLKASVALANRIGLSKIIIGLTVVSFATSAPELIVSINAAIQGSSGISLGNVIGSNIANIGLVLGATILISPIQVPQNFVKKDWLFLMFVTSMLIIFLLVDNFLSRVEGIILIGILTLFVYRLLKRKDDEIELDPELDDTLKKLDKWSLILFYLLIGGVGLWLGADLLVKGAKNIALAFKVSESVIGLTVVAIGTSIPELAASIVAVLKNEKSISFGNLIGSNIFNILSVLGITAIIQPIHVEDTRFLNNDVWWMLGFSFILLPFIFILKKDILGRFEGIVLLIAYVIYIYMAF
ncbi:MAG: calcium/sodium antiporter [Weeksellaceae bacterium]